MIKDRVVLITGAGSRLGLGLARYFLHEGARLALFEVSPARVDGLRAEFGDKVLVYQGDVTSISDILACKKAIVNRFGRLDSLVCAHGIFDGMVRPRDTPLEKLSDLFAEVFTST